MFSGFVSNLVCVKNKKELDYHLDVHKVKDLLLAECPTSRNLFMKSVNIPSSVHIHYIIKSLSCHRLR